MNIKVMRDILIDEIYNEMLVNDNIFFISADFGSPALDKLREKFNDKFINVGIAEQNLINISTGLALEGATVFAYAIAPFLTMRAYEQIRTNLSILSQIREINVNMIGVGAGLSYDVTGPTHHCLEDISIMRMLPNMVLFSPCDYVVAGEFIDYSIAVKRPKYIRLDGKAQPGIYNENEKIRIEDGCFELMKGDEVCIVSTGYMTHKAVSIAKKLLSEKINIGVIDVFLLKPFNENLIFKMLNKYKYVFTMEEAFINSGGLDSAVSDTLRNKKSFIELRKLGFNDKYVFDVGGREYLHKVNGLDEENIIKIIRKKITH